MSPKLGQTKTASVDEDRNYVGVEIDLENGDVEEQAQFEDQEAASEWVKNQIEALGAGPSFTYAFMDAVDFDSLED